MAGGGGGRVVGGGERGAVNRAGEGRGRDNLVQVGSNNLVLWAPQTTQTTRMRNPGRRCKQATTTTITVAGEVGAAGDGALGPVSVATNPRMARDGGGGGGDGKGGCRANDASPLVSEQVV